MYFRLLIIVGLALLINGCGSTGGTTRTYETMPPNQDGGNSLVINGNGNQIEYVILDDGSVLIDCQGGECGPIYNAEEIMIDGSDNSEKASSCTDGVQGECPDGYFYCPIENKCIPR